MKIRITADWTISFYPLLTSNILSVFIFFFAIKEAFTNDTMLTRGPVPVRSSSWLHRGHRLSRSQSCTLATRLQAAPVIDQWCDFVPVWKPYGYWLTPQGAMQRVPVNFSHSTCLTHNSGFYFHVPFIESFKMRSGINVRECVLRFCLRFTCTLSQK